ncbi:LysR family transcriptional regulator [Paraburkholderia sp. 1N]|uniref:LysR family transcriptional regulator n=1 Tax=Paraburkholderia solitsugae TaxID=2675748 RepID=A0ABX2BLF2_9BURK|nr:LysR family transcriptional regulator [Paraburkholderia solitsugae]NPT41762.1 LysR family transcriptional regulator [Paraburkholderia solitsugae]
MDLRRLSHVVALADTLHFALAAEAAHLSQPAFSRSIQAIESELGIRLFDRGGGEVRATPAGEFVIERARKLLFEARCLQREVDLYRDSQLGDTAFGVGPLLSASLMPRALVELRQRYPKIALRMEGGNSIQLLQRLRAENIEFFAADVRDMPNDASLDIQLIGGQLGHLYARAGHPLVGHACTLRAAWNYGIAAPKLLTPTNEELAALLDLPAGQVPELALECDDYSVLKTVVLATDTLLAATDAALESELASGALVRLQVKNWTSVPSIAGIVRLHGRTQSPMAREVIACIARVASEINESPIDGLTAS